MSRHAHRLAAALAVAVLAVPVLAQEPPEPPELPEVSTEADRLLWCGSAIAAMADPGNGVAPVPELAERGETLVGGAAGLLAEEGVGEAEIETLRALYAEDARAIVLGSGAMRYPLEVCARL